MDIAPGQRWLNTYGTDIVEVIKNPSDNGCDRCTKCRTVFGGTIGFERNIHLRGNYSLLQGQDKPA